MTAKEQLEHLAKRFRANAMKLRAYADKQDQNACMVDVLVMTDEQGAKESLEHLMKVAPSWFPS